VGRFSGGRRSIGIVLEDSRGNEVLDIEEEYVFSEYGKKVNG